MKLRELESETHIYFYGGVFSNMTTCQNGVPIEIDNDIVAFRTSEHAFMALKAVEFGDVDSFNQIMNAPTPFDAKKIGRKVKGFDAKKWNSVNTIDELG